MRSAFFNVLTGPELLGVTESHLPEHRERLYPPTVTLVDVHAAGVGYRWFVPEGGQQLGGAMPCGRLELAERSHRRILQSAGALAHLYGGRFDARRR